MKWKEIKCWSCFQHHLPFLGKWRRIFILKFKNKKKYPVIKSDASNEKTGSTFINISIKWIFVYLFVYWLFGDQATCFPAYIFNCFIFWLLYSIVQCNNGPLWSMIYSFVMDFIDFIHDNRWINGVSDIVFSFVHVFKTFDRLQCI